MKTKGTCLNITRSHIVHPYHLPSYNVTRNVTHRNYIDSLPQSPQANQIPVQNSLVGGNVRERNWTTVQGTFEAVQGGLVRSGTNRV